MPVEFGLIFFQAGAFSDARSALKAIWEVSGRLLSDAFEQNLAGSLRLTGPGEPLARFTIANDPAPEKVSG